MKIIEVARILFATNGFDGTSIREIAGKAEVNVASVNYHFSSKEKLFHEILLKGHADCSADIQEMASRGLILEDLLVEVFRYFQTKSHDLLSHFKMMISMDQKIFPQGEEPGPPGGKAIIEMILKEAGSKISEEDLHWALKTLFSHTIHMSLMYNCCFKTNAVPFSSREDIEKGIKRLSRAILRELKEK
jgi:AcrR family transcriptional regulator